jgi:hypothetical protein
VIDTSHPVPDLRDPRKLLAGEEIVVEACAAQDGSGNRRGSACALDRK